jgi:hypothetical protein
VTLAELRDHPLWKILPATIRGTLEHAAEHGWELHGQGATIAFRLDRSQDELDMPVYASWEIGNTPTGKPSWRAGKGGIPTRPLAISDVKEYLEDPSVGYVLEDDCLPSEEVAARILGASPISSSSFDFEVVTSGIPEGAGTPSSAPSTGTVSPLLRITPNSNGSGATPADTQGMSGTSLRLTKESISTEPVSEPQKSVSAPRPLRLSKPSE